MKLRNVFTKSCFGTFAKNTSRKTYKLISKQGFY